MRMRGVLATVLAGCMLAGAGAFAQANGRVFPPVVLAAKTVVILNDTHTMTVEDGATAALKQWGRLQVIDHVDAADIVLHFSKASTHDTSNSQTRDPKDNSQSYGFSVSSSTDVKMTATAKGGFAEFYSTSTGDGKQKAGRECAQSFIEAFQDAQRLKR
ncbi:hypothetical protein D1Y84_04310 [Acidipila sp. EB88]|nr:hypothetical protein D1Y84_04310 [Acidipila sp. EB88]